MTTGTFPSNPSRRKAILVLQDYDIERCSYEPGAAQALLDEEAYVLQFPLCMEKEAPKALQNIHDAGLARPGHILIQSPYDTNTYEEASLAVQRFALAKHMYFSMLCMHLGAKEVGVEQVHIHTSSGKSTLDVKGGNSRASAQVNVEEEELERFHAKMNLCDEFEGGLADVEAGEQLLRRTGLWADPNMRILMEMRENGANQLKTRKLVLNLSSESQSNLKVVGRLKFPPFLQLSVDYKRVVKEQHDYTLTVKVRF